MHHPMTQFFIVKKDFGIMLPQFALVKVDKPMYYLSHQCMYTYKAKVKAKNEPYILGCLIDIITIWFLMNMKPHLSSAHLMA